MFQAFLSTRELRRGKETLFLSYDSYFPHISIFWLKLLLHLIHFPNFFQQFIIQIPSLVLKLIWKSGRCLHKLNNEWLYPPEGMQRFLIAAIICKEWISAYIFKDVLRLQSELILRREPVLWEITGWRWGLWTTKVSGESLWPSDFPRKCNCHPWRGQGRNCFLNSGAPHLSSVCCQFLISHNYLYSVNRERKIDD